eukprot:TRINITY_DN32022_c0_g1_i1.p1 TRINITY_DN32022_c0_g1~~TRINITY_DN32022_c0_g1_i1.p1  ORF type:complete len:142 (-),score=26.82 TRINITY_DN32022_c0_g1_i1:428-853(-)
MVYILAPVALALGLGVAGIGAARVFNLTENAVARAVYNRKDEPYPWPPIYLRGETPPTNASWVGLVAGATLFGISLKLQHRLLWSRVSAVQLRRAPNSKIENYTEFAQELAPEAAAISANVLTSSVLAALIKPIVDGNKRR